MTKSIRELRLEDKVQRLEEDLRVARENVDKIRPAYDALQHEVVLQKRSIDALKAGVDCAVGGVLKVDKGGIVLEHPDSAENLHVEFRGDEGSWLCTTDGHEDYWFSATPKFPDRLEVTITGEATVAITNYMYIDFDDFESYQEYKRNPEQYVRDNYSEDLHDPDCIDCWEEVRIANFNAIEA